MHENIKTNDASFVRNECGGIAIQFGLVLPVLLMLIGGTIDLAMTLSQRAWLQSTVDAAALAAASEMSLSDKKKESIPDVVENQVAAMMKANGSRWDMPQIATTIRNDPLEVEVVAKQKTSLIFGDSFGFNKEAIEVKAVARVTGSPNICVLALEKRSFNAVWLTSSARMTGNDCAVFSNSTSSTSIAVKDNANLKAATICSAGGVDNSGAIDPPPFADCPQFDDPLADRPKPTIGPCLHNSLEIKNEVRTLSPGVYCGGLKISGNSVVTFETGDYIIKDKSFLISDQASVRGEYVSFYLDDRSWLYFGSGTSVELSANKSGSMAGLLFFGSRNQSILITHSILSENAQKLVGTIYLPKNSLIVDGNAQVGGASAYTAIVARRVVLLKGPHLILNSNYDQTDVPVPDGIRSSGQPVQLVN